MQVSIIVLKLSISVNFYHFRLTDEISQGWDQAKLSNMDFTTNVIPAKVRGGQESTVDRIPNQTQFCLNGWILKNKHLPN